MTQQGERQTFFRAINGSASDYNSDFLDAAASEGFTGEFNGVMIQWLQNRTGSSATNLDGLMAEFAELVGADNWTSVGANPILLPNCELWLDAADERATNIVNIADAVSQWSDKSSNGNNVTQGTGDNQPTTGSVTQNSLNTIDFDGSDWLNVPSAIFENIPNGPNTLYVVSKQDTAGNAERVVTFHQSGSTRYDLQYGASAGDIVFQSRDGFGSFVTQTGITATDFTLFKGRRSGTTQAISFNGSAETTNALGADEADCTGGDIGAFNDGASGFLNGTIAEIILYSESHSAAKSSAVEGYLMTKWGT